jgi:hypothetical protein
MGKSKKKKKELTIKGLLDEEFKDIEENKARLADSQEKMVEKVQKQFDKVESLIENTDKKRSTLFQSRDELAKWLESWGVEVHEGDINYESQLRVTEGKLKEAEKRIKELETKIDERLKIHEEYNKSYFPRVFKRYGDFSVQVLNAEESYANFRIYMCESYEPETFPDLQGDFNRVCLILKRSWEETFDFQTEDASYKDYPVQVPQSPCGLIHMGWITDDIPLIFCAFSPADTIELLNVKLDAEKLNDLTVRVLVRMVNFYRGFVKQSELKIVAAEQAEEAIFEELETTIQKIATRKDDWLNEDPFSPTGKKQERAVKGMNKKGVIGIIVFVIVCMIIGILA